MIFEEFLKKFLRFFNPEFRQCGCSKPLLAEPQSLSI